MDLLHFKDNDSNRDVISLFSGAMGLDIGLTKAGLNVVIGQDFDPACVATMRVNGHKVLEGDIREIDESDLLEQAGLVQGEPFLICGGPPCQPFSTAGKRLGINDPRGSLFMDFIRMIDYIRPRFFIMENVKGIMSAPLKHARPIERDKNDPEQQLGTVLDVILSEFDKLGYKTVYRPLSIREYARIQQFPDDWKFMGTSAAKYRQIGNAVPVGLALALGRAVLSVADQSAEIHTKRFRGTDIHQKLKQAIEIGGNYYAHK